MQSSVDISLGIIQRFNLSNSEVEELMSRLSTMLKKGKEKPKEMTKEDKYSLKCEMYLRTKLYPPKKAT